MSRLKIAADAPEFEQKGYKAGIERFTAGQRGRGRGTDQVAALARFGDVTGLTIHKRQPPHSAISAFGTAGYAEGPAGRDLRNDLRIGSRRPR